MKLPWKLKDELKEKEEKIERLEDSIDELEDEKQSWKERFEAEKERRSDLSRKKQEAEEELNRLRGKLETQSSQEVEETAEKGTGFRSLEFEEAEKLLQKLDSIKSPERELVTLYCPEEVEDLSELKSLKNSVDREHYSVLQEEESFVAFIDPELGVFMLKMAPFFSEKFSIGKEFEVEVLLGFLESEKYWALVSAGETAVYSEEGGDLEELEKVKSRVDKEHSKGGFSQGRFERKRDEQIENHLDKTEELLKDYPDAYVLGDKRFCEDLPGKYLGGFDGNRQKPGQFYRFRFGLNP